MDEILSLPVQNPPTLEFSPFDVVWSKVEGWRDNLDRICLIPYARVDDFVRGESANKDCPTRFHVEARRRRTTKTSCKPKVDGILEYILVYIGDAIFKVLQGYIYLVGLLGSSIQCTMQSSNIRDLLLWVDEKWISVGKMCYGWTCTST